MRSRDTHPTDWLIVACLLPPLIIYTTGALVGRLLHSTRIERWCRVRAVALGARAKHRLAGLPEP